MSEITVTKKRWTTFIKFSFNTILFVIKSGKWSMADVMVVAFFMAYIGFNGVVSSQLDGIGRKAQSFEIFTTSGTQLLGGFYLFLSFCIYSLILSEILRQKSNNSS